MTLTQQRVSRGIPAGGQFKETSHTEAEVNLPPISVPSNPFHHHLVFEDSLSNGERRDATRSAIEETLDGDDFDVVHNAAQKAAIRAEAARDDSVDIVIDDLEIEGCKPHQFGADAARRLLALHQEKEAAAKHYVPSADVTFDAAAAYIPGTPQEYLAALREHLPNVDARWYENMLQNQQLQPESWHRLQLRKLAVMNELNTAATSQRPEVPVEENAHFRSHPVTPLESEIDKAILSGVDPTDRDVVDMLHGGSGRGFGTANIRMFARWRMEERR